MPTPSLQSAQLYRVGNLPGALQAMRLPGNVAGYEQLRGLHFKARQRLTRYARITPPVGKVVGNMLLHGGFAKYVTCTQISEAVQCVAQDENIPLAPLEIEEHEHVIVHLKRGLESIATRCQVHNDHAPKLVAEKCDKHAGLIHAMARGFRTTQERCAIVLQVVRDLIADPNAEVLARMRIAVHHPTAERRAISDQMILDFDAAEDD